jgi:hypothetical protein
MGRFENSLLGRVVTDDENNEDFLRVTTQLYGGGLVGARTPTNPPRVGHRMKPIGGVSPRSWRLRRQGLT